MALFSRAVRLSLAPVRVTGSTPVLASRSLASSRVLYNDNRKKGGRKDEPKPAQATAPVSTTSPPASDVSLDHAYAFRGVPGRYTKVVLEYARKFGQDKTVREELQRLNHALQSDYSFRSMFHRVPTDKLDASDITKILLEELRAKGHVHHFGAIVKTYESAIRAINNEKHLTLVTARPLSSSELTSVRSMVKSEYAPNSELVLKNEVDSSIVGGFVIHTEDLVFDLSLKTLLSRWFAQQEESIQLEHEKRMTKIQQSIKVPEAPLNSAFLQRVQAGIQHLEKETGINELRA